MPTWPKSPVATVRLAHAYYYTNIPQLGVIWHVGSLSRESLAEPDIEWTAAIEFTDDGESIVQDNYFAGPTDNPRGWGEVSAMLFRAPQGIDPITYSYGDINSYVGNWEMVDQQVVLLGDSTRGGFFSGYITVRATMDATPSLYKLVLLGRTGMFSDLSATPQFPSGQGLQGRLFVVDSGSSYIGDITLGFFPLSIAYCPPEQDMSASIAHSLNYGIRFTLGTSESFSSSSTVGIQGDITAVGTVSGSVSTTNSRRLENMSSVATEISFSRSSTLTADNQRAIGRAFWGPLGDLFAIGVNGRFAVYQSALGSFTYENTNIEDIVVLPAHKLLRPEDDQVALRIPPTIRHELLKLDPGLTNLEHFFPMDQGRPLSDAAAPEAVPGNNRAELIGRWWMGKGTVINYSMGQEIKLETGETNEITFETTTRIELRAGFDLNFVVVKLGLQTTVAGTYTTSLRYQSSRETFNRDSVSANCLLIRNQNAQDVSGIEIYYDKVFSSFYFRIIPTAPGTRLAGTITDVFGSLVTNTIVELLQGDKKSKALTDSNGRYMFYGVKSGKANLVVGITRVDVRIKATSDQLSECQYVNVKNVKRVLDLDKSCAWELANMFGSSSEATWRVSRFREGIYDLNDLAFVLGIEMKRLKQIVAGRVEIKWAKTTLRKLKGIKQREAIVLEDAGVTSVQLFWQMAGTKQARMKLRGESRIPESRLKELFDISDRSRAMRTKAGAPPDTRGQVSRRILT